MKNFGLKVKLAATALAFAGLFAGSTAASAGVLSGIGTISVNSDGYVSRDEYKTTTNGSSTITFGDITIYKAAQVTTYCEKGPNEYEQSNPWTVCNANASTYLGWYVSIDAKIGQKVHFEVKPLSYASDSYTADITSWNYQ